MPIHKKAGGTVGRGDQGSKRLGSRHNQDKLPLHLVAPSAILAIAEVSADGAEIYGERNWEAGFGYSTSYASLMRHLLAWWGGEDFDSKSGKLHTHHIVWNAHAIVEHERRVTEGSLPAELDDRPNKGVD